MSAPPSDPASTLAEKARDIIEDAFRRADKNDDGSLSLEEFQAFFNDGTISNEELKEIFHQIDTHHTDNLDVGELCDYFAKFWSSFEKAFATIDDLGVTITEVIRDTAQYYQGKTHFEKFATRFLMKEVMNHVSAIERTLEVTVEKIEEEGSSKKQSDSTLMSDNKQIDSKPRWQQKLDRSLSGGTPLETTAILSQEVSRLSSLIDKLESKVLIEPLEEEEIAPGKDATVLVVSYKIECLTDKKQEFRNMLKSYVLNTRSQTDCIHVGVQVINDANQFIVYEVWRKRESWESHEGIKSLQLTCAEILAKPLESQHMELPDSWLSSI